jgi:Cytokinin dehydrogenase 1, FAD and cytokinin binding
VFLFDVLTADFPNDSNPDAYVSTEIPAARARFEAARVIGGTLYPTGSTPMSKADWAQQYGPEYAVLKQLKELYDPAHILTPGILKEFGHEQQRYNDDGRRGEESQILAAHDLASHWLGQRPHQMVGKQRCRARQFWRPMQPDFRAWQRWQTVALRQAAKS